LFVVTAAGRLQQVAGHALHAPRARPYPTMHSPNAALSSSAGTAPPSSNVVAAATVAAYASSAPRTAAGAWSVTGVREVGLRKPRPRPAMLAIFGPHTVSVSQANLRGTGF
jgi:hypothetical protein